MKKRRSPFRWLLLIPAQLAVGAAFAAFGMWLDSRMFSAAAEAGAQGHGAPAFSLIFVIIALAVTAIVIVLAVILVIVGLARRRRRELVNRDGSL